jgi:arabinofuranan 3-O-arabinosyltransferase
MLGLLPWLVRLRALKRFLLHRHLRYVLAWLLAVGCAATVLERAVEAWDYPQRRDGCSGHTTIDFGGSWIMGRMFVLGEGQFLYDRHHLRNVLSASYPREDEDPNKEDKRTDAENLMYWFMGDDSEAGSKTYASCLRPLAARDGLSAFLLTAAAQQDAWTEAKLAEAAAHRVGGPLYPPVNIFMAGPLGLFSPLTAYRLHQGLELILVLGTSLGVYLLSSGRIWVPVAATVLVLYPGFYGSLSLSQNSGLSLAIFVWGWVLIARNRPGWGGVVWGLLAFKPVWAMSFFFVLMLSRRWRACLTMLACGAVLALLTLPFVGLHSWLDWLQVGREATFWYNVDSNWIHRSRDLLSIPRRYLLDFDVYFKDRDVPAAAPIGWALLLTVAALTIALAVWRWKERPATAGPRAAFLLLGGWLCCFHFMYYDVLLTYLPMVLLLSAPQRYLRPRLWRRQVLEWGRRLVPPRAGSSSVLDGAAATRDGALAVFHFPPTLHRGRRNVAVFGLLPRVPYGWLGLRNPVPLVTLAALLFIENPLRHLWDDNRDTPVDTFCLIALWAWCGWVWLRRRRQVVLPGPGEHEGGQPRALPQRAHVRADEALLSPATSP